MSQRTAHIITAAALLTATACGTNRLPEIAANTCDAFREELADRGTPFELTYTIALSQATEDGHTGDDLNQALQTECPAVLDLVAQEVDLNE